MARGDVIADVFTCSAGSTTSIQPGSGVEWVLKTIGLHQSSGMFLQGYDGSTATHVATGVYTSQLGGAITMPINNTNYAAIYNGEGYTSNAAYFGYITKE